MEMECNNDASYYSVLGVGTKSSDEDIRRAYRKLAMQWHPDRWSRTPLLLGEAKNKFQQIQEAYSVLSDKTKRLMYDAGLYNCFDEDDEVEGFSEFVQEMMSLVEDARKEEKSCSIEELQGMFWDMAQSFQTTTDGSSCNNYVNSDNNPSNQTLYDDRAAFGDWLCDGSFTTFYDNGNEGGDLHCGL